LKHRDLFAHAAEPKYCNSPDLQRPRSQYPSLLVLGHVRRRCTQFRRHLFALDGGYRVLLLGFCSRWAAVLSRLDEHWFPVLLSRLIIIIVVLLLSGVFILVLVQLGLGFLVVLGICTVSKELDQRSPRTCRPSAPRAVLPGLDLARTRSHLDHSRRRRRQSQTCLVIVLRGARARCALGGG
jgi:hypothetical protein